MTKITDNYIIYEIKDDKAYVEGVEDGYPSTLIIPQKVNDHKVISIKNGALCQKKISYIHLPDTLINIGQHAIDTCGVLNETITIPDSVETIGSYAFSNNNIKEFIVGKSLSSYGVGAFSHNTNSYRIAVSEENKYFASYIGCLYDRSLATLYCAPPKLKQAFEFSISVYCLKHRSFQVNTFSSLIIPQTVAVIEADAFFYTSNIKEMQILGNIVSIGSLGIGLKIETIIYRGTKTVRSQCIPETLNITVYVCSQYKSNYFGSAKVIVQGECPLFNSIAKCCTRKQNFSPNISYLLISLCLS